MKVAIIGSRNYPDLDKVREFVRKLSPDDTVVFGGADMLMQLMLKEAFAA